MISLEGEKSKALIQKIQEHEAPAKEFSDLFSAADLELIHQVKKRCYDDPGSQLSKTEGIAISKGCVGLPNPEETKVLSDLVKARLGDEISQDCEMSFSFHRNFFPYGIHTDSGYDPNELIYKQGIIPLQVIPDGASVYTVIFQQKCYHSASYPRDRETIETLTDEQRSALYGFVEHEAIPDKQIDHLWDELEQSRFWLKGFQIALAFEWKIGSMALWDRAHLHCSSDFKEIEGKLGLMWVSRLPQQSDRKAGR